MKFRINAEQFNRAIALAADIALKNIRKDKEKRVFYYAEMLTIEASSKILSVRAYGGWASITVKVRDTEGYICENDGLITIEAKKLVDALKSFSPMGNLFVYEEDYQLKLSLESDRKVFVELPTIDLNVKCPQLPLTFDQETTVDKACFVRGMKKVMYAMAKEENLFTYTCTLFQCWKNRMRFTAGTGGRFAVFEIAERRQIASSDDIKIVFPRQNIGNVIRIFDKAGTSTIQVKTADDDPRNEVCEQLLLESDSIVLALYGLEKYTKYPDVDRILNHNYPYQIPTRAEDWVHVGKAIHAARSGRDYVIHNTRITADLMHGYFKIHTNTKMPFKERIDFELGRVVADTSKVKTYQPWICCYSTYIEEIARKGYKDGIMIISFDDQAKLDEIPDDKPKQMKPVLFTYPERANRDGTTEKYAVFFTVTTKW
jgi:DNA polymerase III sliding clamp (beta) subunit (PCNA family)